MTLEGIGTMTRRFHVWAGLLPQGAENRYMRYTESGQFEMPSRFFRDIGIGWRERDWFTDEGPRWSGLWFSKHSGRARSRSVVRDAIATDPDKFGSWARAVRSLRLSDGPTMANTVAVIWGPAVRFRNAKPPLKYLGSFAARRRSG